VKPKYLLPCSCGHQTPVEASQAGQQIRCECGAVLEVPTMRGIAQLDRAGPESLAAGAFPPGATKQASKAVGLAAKRSSSNWGPRQGVLLVGGVITGLALCLASYYYVSRPRIIDATILAPIETWQLWFDLNQGIDQRPPWEEMYLRGVANYHRWMILASTIAGIGVLIMAGALFAPRKRQKQRASGPAP
jgi:hypothetical protein